MKRLLSWLLLAALAWSCLPALAQSNDDNDLDELQTQLTNEWRLVRFDRKRNIKTWMRQEDGKRYRSFKVEAELNTSVEAVARLMLDFANYDKWYWQVKESKLLKQVSPTEYLVYLVHRAPAGLPDRDAVLRGVVVPQNKGQKYVVVRISAEPDYLPEKPPLVRLPAQEMYTKFTPMGNGKVLMETEGYVDPGGKVPVWAANFVQRSAPYTIVLAMQRQLQSGEYDKGKRLPFPVYDLDYFP
ncbi:START domain-containing protein [Fluviicoccus keumensis]|uniref:START domain-containing protein n=1 Tax=Fluviicoccus keumensis TaxID=1435465 RepID=A0A4Q7YLG6_9GAMM|nr:START domain-containing protein [Fluviicoccus keumensis]RZU38407.1 START domain-containing protein [Fluviicoccus keumensis]